MSQIKKLTTRAQEMYALIEKYLSTDLKQKTFCAQHGVAYSTFHWWLRHYKNHNAASMTARSQSYGDFVPVHVAAPDTSKLLSSTCHIEYPNGVIVHLLHADVRVISELIGLQKD